MSQTRRRPRAIHYLALESVTNPAVVSQAVGTALELSECSSRKVYFWGLRRPNDREAKISCQLASLLSSKGISARFFINHRDDSLLKTICMAGEVFVACFVEVISTRPAVIVARNPFSGLLALVLTRLIHDVDYLVDLRSDTISEIKMSETGHRRGFLIPVMKLLLQTVLRKSSGVFCVSEVLARKVSADCGYEIETYTVPSCLLPRRKSRAADINLLKLRRKLLGRAVFVYAGTITAWNRPEPMIKVFEEIKRHDERCFFLFLTPSILKALKAFEEYGTSTDDFHVQSVDQDRIDDYLGLGHIGILIREDSFANRVASPVKLPEYLRAGLALMISDGIGDWTQIVEGYDVGVVLRHVNLTHDKDAVVDGYMKLTSNLSSISVRSRQLACELFERKKYRSIYLKALGLQ
jgi:hypothetical protein